MNALPKRKIDVMAANENVERTSTHARKKQKMAVSICNIDIILDGLQNVKDERMDQYNEGDTKQKALESERMVKQKMAVSICVISNSLTGLQNVKDEVMAHYNEGDTKQKALESERMARIDELESAFKLSREQKDRAEELVNLLSQNQVLKESLLSVAVSDRNELASKVSHLEHENDMLKANASSFGGTMSEM